jgi:hypothetical protein
VREISLLVLLKTDFFSRVPIKCLFVSSLSTGVDLLQVVLDLWLQIWLFCKQLINYLVHFLIFSFLSFFVSQFVLFLHNF